jgi:DNA-binding MarR family transcriptional regulator
MEPRPVNTRPVQTFLQTMRAAHPDMTASQMLTLFIIAERPGITVGELKTRVGYLSTGASRIVRTLSDWKRYQVPGLGLVKVDDDARDLRLTRAFLSDRGRAVVAQALGSLQHA